MEHFPGLLWALLVGNSGEPKRLAAGAGVIVLPIFGVLALFAAGADDPSSDLCFVLAIGSFITTIILVVLLVIWRIQGVSIPRKPEDVYATIKELRQLGKLTDGDCPLIMANWEGVSLQGADLHNANLNRIGLESADLRHANFYRANLRSARLESANLSDSNLTGAILCYARLGKADLRNAQLADADLTAADLSDALLKGANIDGAHFDTFTTLPDGSKWTRNTRWARFGVKT
jgi:hypothetical protein